MTKKIIIASIVCSFALPASAQLSTDSLPHAKSQSAKTEVGDLLITLAGALKPESYTPDYAKQKTAFLNRSKSAKSGSVLGANIGEFISYIRPEKFKKDIDVAGLMSKSKSISSQGQCADLLKSVEESLKPEAISSMWSLSKSGWQKEVKQIQQSKK